MVDENFEIPPPTAESEYKPHPTDIPPGMEAAWILQLIEFHLPDKLKRRLLPFMKQILDVAAKTNILRSEIPIQLLQYDEIWTGYKVFENSGKLEPELKTYYSQIRQAFELQLCRSVGGWQGDLVFKKHYEVKQTKGEQMAKKGFGFFKTRNPPDEQEG